MSNIDSGALDRALCLELRIPPMYEICSCGHFRTLHIGDGRCETLDDLLDINPCQCTEYREQIINYLPISNSTGAVLTLTEALAEKYPEAEIHFARPTPNLWRASVSIDDELTCERSAERLPMAFALAVAAALGLEVPR